MNDRLSLATRRSPASARNLDGIDYRRLKRGTYRFDLVNTYLDLTSGKGK